VRRPHSAHRAPCNVTLQRRLRVSTSRLHALHRLALSSSVSWTDGLNTLYACYRHQEPCPQHDILILCSVCKVYLHPLSAVLCMLSQALVFIFIGMLLCMSCSSTAVIIPLYPPCPFQAHYPLLLLVLRLKLLVQLPELSPHALIAQSRPLLVGMPLCWAQAIDAPKGRRALYGDSS
jgi:hypothetical protein